MEEHRQLFHKHNLRVTPQRELIYKVLSSNKEHPTVEAIFDEVKKLYPSISLNTVYKTLEMFAHKGIVKRLIVGINIYRFDANINPHAHIMCMECKQVDDIDGKLSGLTEEIKQEVNINSDYEVTSVDILLYGCCKECNARG